LPTDLSQEIEPPLVLATSTTFDAWSRVHCCSSLGCSPARILLRTFDPTLTTTPIETQQLGLVWGLLLKADPEGPTLISRAACPRGQLFISNSPSACCCSTRSMAGLCAPLPTLRRHPRGWRRTARGRCGSLLLHRSGLAPPTPCRFWPAHLM